MLKLGVKKAAIYFDIDRTLIDAAKLREFNRGGMCKTLGLDREKIFFIIDQYERSLLHKNDFCLDDMIKRINKETGINNSILKETHDKPKNYEMSLYNDVIETLRKLTDCGYSLGIYSEGLLEGQLNKLKLSGIYKLFDEDKIIIESRKLRPEIVNKIGKAMVVDDWPGVIDHLAQFPKITPIWLNRIDDKQHNIAKTIFNLNEIN